MSDSLHTLLGCKIIIQLEHSDHVRSTEHFNKPGHLEFSVRSIPTCEFHSTKQWFQPLSRLYQSKTRSKFRLVLACTLVVFGTVCYVNRFWCRFFLTKRMYTLVPLVKLGVDVSVQSTGVSNCIRFH